MYKAELKSGGALPDWITIDPETGKIAADPSKGRTGSAAPAFLTESLQVLELKIIAEDEDGKERVIEVEIDLNEITETCLLYTSPSPRDRTRSRMPSSA